MNSLEAIYFPGTAIYSARQFPVFLLLEKAHLLRPVELPDTPGDSPDIFITSGLCQEYTPCPLGDNRDRFLRLIKDIRERKDDYAAQLSALTIASLSAKKSSIDDTTRGIISSLLGSHGVATSPEVEQDDQLWQARLVLKIAEILDQEEEEVAVQMAMLEDQEQDLFKELQGELDDEEDESLLDELRQVQDRIARPTATTVKNRLNGWSKLYRAAVEPECRLWLTHLEEAADILLEKYENATKLPAKGIAELELPANIGWSREDAVESMLNFRKTSAELRTEISAALSKPNEDILHDLCHRWSQAVDAAFPSEQYGRTTLVIYQLPSTGCSSLLGKTNDSGQLLGVVR
ncbi:thioredoxin domain-containing protein [Desulfopila aestuarii]|uniref:Uncharacterized protein n=1 Tax=Desulfopila aestuarii DSM 18488 TaxID=1121416 RepID=A0A1M7YHV8_9BACT|nr:hypothetical protein [Desulfopila aestuarii]SHO52210.1 hypothetical protein SAMN02745220_04420 [Desulfopila aestuarii DSM 18488]